MNPWSVLLAWGALQGVFLAVAVRVAGRPQRRPPPAALSWLLLLLSIFLVEHVLIHNGVLFTDRRGFIVFLSTPLTYLHGPLFLAYARGLGGRRLRHPLLHALPALLFAASYLPAWADAGRRLLSGAGAGEIAGPWVAVNGYVAWALQIAQAVAYVAVALRELRRFEVELEDRRSRSGVVHADWLRRFAWLTLGVLAAEAVALVGMITIRHVATLEFALGLATALSIHFVGFAVMAQPGVFTAAVPEPEAEPPPPSAEGDARPRYARSGLTGDHLERLRARVLAAMESGRLWEDPDLSLATLARQSGSPPAHVSQVLNQVLGVRFFDFVNGYRIEAVKRSLEGAAAAGTRPNLLEVALAAGFSGKSSFHRVFREAVGVAPSRYLQSLRSGGNGKVPAAGPGRHETAPGRR